MNYRDYINSKQWRLLRNEAMALHDYKCLYCGTNATEVHHHKYPPSDRWELDKLSNLQPVCRACHEKLHLRKGLTMKLKVYDRASFPLLFLEGTDLVYVKTDFAKFIPVRSFVEDCLKLEGEDARLAIHVISNECELVLARFSKKNAKFRDLNAIHWVGTQGNELCLTYDLLRQATGDRCNNIRMRLNDERTRGNVSAAEQHLLDAFENFLVAYMPIVNYALARLETSYENHQLQIQPRQAPLPPVEGQGFAGAMQGIASALMNVSQALAGLGKRTADENRLMQADHAAALKGINPSWLPRKDCRHNAETLIGMQAKVLFGEPPAVAARTLRASGSKEIVISVAERPFWQWIEAIDRLEGNDWTVTKPDEPPRRALSVVH